MIWSIFIVISHFQYNNYKLYFFLLSLIAIIDSLNIIKKTVSIKTPFFINKLCIALNYFIGTFFSIASNALLSQSKSSHNSIAPLSHAAANFG